MINVLLNSELKKNSYDILIIHDSKYPLLKEHCGGEIRSEESHENFMH